MKKGDDDVGGGAHTTKTTEATRKLRYPKDEAVLIDFCSLGYEEVKRIARENSTLPSTAAEASTKLRAVKKKKKTENKGGEDDDDDVALEEEVLFGDHVRSVSSIGKEDVLRVQPLTWYEHVLCVMFLSVAPPNGVFTVPLVTFLTGQFVLGDFGLAVRFVLFIMIPLALVPQPFVPSSLTSYLAVLMAKYFSFRFIFEEPSPVRYRELDPQERSDDSSATTAATTATTITENYRHPQILAAPPHGVFPYGNVLSMIAFPVVCRHGGFWFRGLASSAALRVPVFKQILGVIGIVDASRDTAKWALGHYPNTIGISTGGVAEVYETHANDECIVLRERIGMIKLAIRTGADLIPCYLFGNTKLLSCWTGGNDDNRRRLEKISRKLGFALIWVHGRYGLPIPYRYPILAVRGRAIPTHQYDKCQQPTEEMIKTVQNRLLQEIERIFDQYKSYYGWDDKRLIIK